MNRLADFQRGDVDKDDLGQIFWKRVNFEPMHDVSKHATILDPGGLAGGLDGHLNRHLLVRGHLVEVHVEDVARQGVVLDFLHEREALRAGVTLHGDIHEDVLACVGGDGVSELAGVQFEVLRRRKPTIDDRGDGAGGAKFLNGGVFNRRARLRIHGYRFHVRFYFGTSG